ncbi:carbonic anhydrase [Cellulomonas sp. SG140]|uniref:carbonic anhydrase n=1 Tax=Cellulomonas sp. SG140 TaxID=2976536 RepID=UPI0021E86643|nr:carbonic anhydrase [Cellulomonas sp. SG140]
MTSTTDRPTTPGEAWAALLEGNERFVRGEMVHPSQDAAHRAALSSSQQPFAVVFGCSDSRVAAEIVFDQGLGDAFVVRTAGHVIDTTVLGSIEFGVEVLGTPLVVVLAHDKCGAVAAAAKTLASGEQAPGFVRAVVDRVIPSIVGLTSTGKPLDSFDAAELGHEHVRQTAHMLNDYSAVLSRRTADGSCAIVAVEYTLEDGRAKLVETVGRLD